MKATITKLQNGVRGFQPIEGAAKDMYQNKPIDDCFAYAYGFLSYPSYQIRSLGVLLLGRIAVKNPRALQLLQQEVGKDRNEAVQEALVKAFGYYCNTVGYYRALAAIKEWLADEQPAVRRAAIAAIRYGMSLTYLRAHPDVAIELLSSRRNDPSIPVRKATGKALRAFRKYHPRLVDAALQDWDRNDPATLETYYRVYQQSLAKACT